MDKFFPVTVVVFNNFSFLHIVCDGGGNAMADAGRKKKDIIYIIIFALRQRCSECPKWNTSRPKRY